MNARPRGGGAAVLADCCWHSAPVFGSIPTARSSPTTTSSPAPTRFVGLFGDDRKTYLATLVGRDPLTDSALIRLKDAPGNLPSTTLGDSDALEPGDWVMPDADHPTAMVAATPAGSRVPLTFYRNGSRQTTTATIEELDLENNPSRHATAVSAARTVRSVHSWSTRPGRRHGAEQIRRAAVALARAGF